MFVRWLSGRVGKFVAAGAVLAAVGTASIVAWNAASPAQEAIRAADGPFDGGTDGGPPAYWSSIASAAVVDNDDLDLVDFTGTIAAIKTTAPASCNVVLRFPVTANDNLTGTDPSPFLHARWKDNGAPGRVIIRLKEFNVLNGATTTLITIDSDLYAQSNLYREEFLEPDDPFTFNFQNRVYFVDVTISRTSTVAKPALASVIVGRF